MEEGRFGEAEAREVILALTVSSDPSHRLAFLAKPILTAPHLPAERGRLHPRSRHHPPRPQARERPLPHPAPQGWRARSRRRLRPERLRPRRRHAFRRKTHNSMRQPRIQRTRVSLTPAGVSAGVCVALALTTPTPCGARRIYGSSGYGYPADMWSLGVICFALLGGRFPYKQTEPRALVSCALAGARAVRHSSSG
jgi:hypothetical protein